MDEIEIEKPATRPAKSAEEAPRRPGDHWSPALMPAESQGVHLPYLKEYTRTTRPNYYEDLIDNHMLVLVSDGDEEVYEFQLTKTQNNEKLLQNE